MTASNRDTWSSAVWGCLAEDRPLSWKWRRLCSTSFPCSKQRQSFQTQFSAVSSLTSWESTHQTGSDVCDFGTLCIWNTVQIINQHFLTFLHMIPGSLGEMKPSSQIPPTEKFLLIVVMNTCKSGFISLDQRNCHLFSLLEWKGSVCLFFQSDCVVDRFEGV